MRIDEYQKIISEIYLERDQNRGISETIAWLAEEVGELAKAVRKGTKEEQLHELSDVFAWTVSLANQLDLDMTEAAIRFANACPSCESKPCRC